MSAHRHRDHWDDTEDAGPQRPARDFKRKTRKPLGRRRLADLTGDGVAVQLHERGLEVLDAG